MSSLRRISPSRLAWFVLSVLSSALAAAANQLTDTSKLSLTEKEAFLLNAKIVKKWHTPRGVANPWRATMDDGKTQHDAHIQTIDLSRSSYETSRGTEHGFRDTYKYNIAAYELAKILELDMVPPSVGRKVDGQNAAVSWWVDNKMFDEVDRILKKIEPPDRDSWDKQMQVVRVFDQLIYNTDRNRGNLVITNDWQIWMIDHTKAFRLHKNLLEPHDLAQCDRKLLGKLRELDRETLRQRLRGHLTGAEIDAILPRRDKIVRLLEDEIASKGEAAVLYDLAAVRK